MKTPLNKQTLSQHLTYSWWKYLLLAALAFGAVDLLYTVTAYRTPNEKKVEFFVYGYANTDALNSYMEQVRQEYLPEMEQMTSLTIMDDATYGSMQLTTYMAAAEGDLYLLPRDTFLSTAGNGGFLPLEDDLELMALFDEAGISLQSGWRKDTGSGETHLFGIPASKLPGLSQYMMTKDCYLTVLYAGGNIENTLSFLHILVKDMLTPPAETTEDVSESSKTSETP